MAERKRRRTRRLTPLPEAVRQDGRSWELKNGRQAGVTFSRSADAPHAMTVPMGDDPVSLRHRVHATAVAKWSPVRMKADPVLSEAGVLEACETARVQYLSQRVGLRHLETPTLIPFGEDAQAAFAAAVTKDPRIGAALLMRYAGTADEPVVRQALEEVGPLGSGIGDLVDRVLRDVVKARRGKDPAPTANTIRAAEAIQDVLGADRDWEDQEEALNVLEADQDARELEDLGEKIYGDEGDGDPRWTSPDFVEPPRPLMLPARLRARRRRSADIGTAPVLMHRFVTDGRVFRERKKGQGGGAVLIDISGSMRLSREDVVALVAAMPAGVMATYEGNGCGRATLKVIARNGRRVRDAELVPEMGGNDCDLPALEWLEQQAGPRFWVSDGYVIPGGGGSHTRAFKECAAVMRRAGIRRIESADALVGRLTGSEDPE